MDHIIFLFYLLSLITGCISIGIAFFIYRQYKKTVIFYYIGFLISLGIILTQLTCNVYFKITGLSEIVAAVRTAQLFGLFGSLGIIIICPLFFHTLFGVAIPNFLKPTLFSVAGFLFILQILRWFGIPLAFLNVLFVSCLVISGGYAFSIFIPQRKAIANKLLAKALRLLFVLSVVFFPLIILEIVRGYIPFLKEFHLFEIFTLPLYFLIINILSIFFSARYLNQPAFYEAGKLTDHFISQYNITPREREIIKNVIFGKTYNTIADELCIAYKTVDNHISNIYRKTEVNSRNQLTNLILSNSA